LCVYGIDVALIADTNMLMLSLHFSMFWCHAGDTKSSTYWGDVSQVWRQASFWVA